MPPARLVLGTMKATAFGTAREIPFRAPSQNGTYPPCCIWAARSSAPAPNYRTILQA